MEHFADPTTELAISTPGDLSTLRNYDPAVDEVTVELQQAVLNMCYHLPGYEQQASVLHEELVSYLISHVAKEEKSSICIGIQPKTSDGTAAPCTNKAKHLNCCGMHKRQTFGTYVCGVTTMPTAELCVACESHGEETDPLVQCVTCPLVWHRGCLAPWAANHGALDRLEGASLQCARCSHYRSGWTALKKSDELLKIFFLVPLPHRFLLHDSSLVDHAALQANSLYGEGCTVPGMPDRADYTPLVRTPHNYTALSADEKAAMNELNVEKGVSSALRRDVQIRFRSDTAEGGEETPAPPRGQLGMIFAQPPSGATQPAATPRAPPNLKQQTGVSNPYYTEQTRHLEGGSHLPPPHGGGPPPAPAGMITNVEGFSGNTGDLAAILASLKSMGLRTTAMELAMGNMSSRSGASSSSRLIPVPPTNIEGPKANCDGDGFHISETGNCQNAGIPMGWDYGGMSNNKCHMHRISGMMGVERLDQMSRNMYTPEEVSSRSTVTINGTEIKTSSTQYGVPTKYNVDLFFAMSIRFLEGVLASGEGVFDTMHPYYEFHVQQIKSVQVRIVFMAATIDNLHVTRTVPIEWGLAWRYMLRLIDDNFKGGPLSEFGLDADLLALLRTIPSPSLEMRGHAAVTALARKHFSQYTLEEVRASVAAHAASIVPAKKSGGDANNNGGDNGGPCVLCGGFDCGKYVKNSYLCKKPITVRCQKCFEYGFTVKHARAGPRAIVNGTFKGCDAYRKELKDQGKTTA